MDTLKLKCELCECHTTHLLMNWSLDDENGLVALTWKCKLCETEHHTKVAEEEFFGGEYHNHRYQHLSKG